MSTELKAAIDKAIADLPRRSVVKKDGREFEVRSLVPYSDWRPLAASWWKKKKKKKEACVIADDSCGNFYLRVCDGTVRFWDHEIEQDKMLFPSVREFLIALSPRTPVDLKPGQVKRVWVDPNFKPKFE
jgi:hypothetical protein